MQNTDLYFKGATVIYGLQPFAVRLPLQASKLERLLPVFLLREQERILKQAFSWLLGGWAFVRNWDDWRSLVSERVLLHPMLEYFEHFYQNKLRQLNLCFLSLFYLTVYYNYYEAFTRLRICLSTYSLKVTIASFGERFVRARKP